MVAVVKKFCKSLGVAYMTVKERGRTFDLHLLGIGTVLWEIRIAGHGSRRVKTDDAVSNSREMLWAKGRTHKTRSYQQKGGDAPNGTNSVGQSRQ
jgi:hypothetical protein